MNVKRLEMSHISQPTARPAAWLSSESVKIEPVRMIVPLPHQMFFGYITDRFDIDCQCCYNSPTQGLTEPT